MIVGRCYRDGRPTGEPVDPLQVRELSEPEGSFVWLDATDPTQDDLALLGDAFGLHPLTIEDIRHRHQRPRVELFEDYAFVVLRPLSPVDDAGLRECEMHILAGRGFLVTLRFGDPYPLDEVVRRWERQPEMLRLGTGFAVYVLMDEVVDDYLSLVERFEDRADDLEDAVFGTADPYQDRPIQQRLFRLKRETVQLRRYAMPLRQGLDLLQEQPRLAAAGLAPYYRDVMDHVIRVVELVDNVRDLLTSLLEVRVSQAANRMNEVMKSLTAWATILLVPTLLAGIWGMNFRHMPELQWRYGYVVAIGTIFASAGALYAWFKWKKRWL